MCRLWYVFAMSDLFVFRSIRGSRSFTKGGRYRVALFPFLVLTVGRCKDGLENIHRAWAESIDASGCL